jgi:hypothetical protein
MKFFSLPARPAFDCAYLAHVLYLREIVNQKTLLLPDSWDEIKQYIQSTLACCDADRPMNLIQCSRAVLAASGGQALG